METFAIVAPILLLVLLGAVLARVRFLGTVFIADLNKLAFYIALPALVFHSVAHADKPGPQTLHLFGLLVLVTLVGAAAGWGAALLLGGPPALRGTLAQAAFRGNLAYIGVPVLSYAFDARGPGREAFATGVVVMTALMAFFNILAVVVLKCSSPRRAGIGDALWAIATNPLLIAGVAGLVVGLAGWRLPLVFDRSLAALAGAAVPIALLCIGGSLALARIHERIPAVVVAALLKTAFVPAVFWVLAPLCGLHSDEIRVGMVLAACPTAAAAYVMAKQMDGDEALASGSIVLSTVLSAASLWIALALTA